MQQKERRKVKTGRGVANVRVRGAHVQLDHQRYHGVPSRPKKVFVVVLFFFLFLFASCSSKVGVTAQTIANPPTGLVLTNSVSVGGGILEVEWSAPVCQNQQEGEGTEEYIYKVWFIDFYNPANNLVQWKGPYAKCRGSGLDAPRAPIRTFLTTLTPHSTWHIYIQARGQDEPNSTPFSEPSNTITATPSPTPRGSGRAQLVASQLPTG